MAMTPMMHHTARRVAGQPQRNLSWPKVATASMGGM